MRNAKFNSGPSRVSVLLMAGCISSLASAQDNTSAAGLEEVVVTAQRREERLQDVPIAITAVTGDALDRMGARDIGDLTGLAPNVSFQPVSVVPSGAITYIRGIGERSIDNLTDQPNAISIDGVYLQGSHGALLDVFDLERVEVLRGPQGTLQGRNATGGAINMITRRPSLKRMQMKGEIDYGRFSTWTTKASVDGPLVRDKLAAKLSVISTDSDGYVKNVHAGGHQGGRRYTVARMGLLYEPSENFDMYFSGDYVWDTSQQPPARNATNNIAYPRPETGAQGVSLICTLFNECTPDRRYTVRSAYTDRNATDQGMASLTANWRLDAVQLTSISGYRKLLDHVKLDLDFTPLEFLTVQEEYTKGETYSQEIRVASNEGGGPLNWVAGVYYYHDEWTHDSIVCLPALGIPCGGPPTIRAQELESYAAFAHAEYALTDRWKVFAGARYTNDKKDFRHVTAPIVAAEEEWSEPTAEAGVRFHVNDDSTVYLRFSQGYRSGGFNPSGITYDPETVDSLELGMKSIIWDQRLSLNAAIFSYDYKDLQRGVVLPSTSPPFYIQGTLNAAEVTIRGAELEMTARPIPELILRTSIGYLDAEYDKYIDNIINTDGSLTPVDNSGLRTPYSPKWTTSTGFDYTVDLGDSFPVNELMISVDHQYRSRFTTNPADLPVGDQEGYGLVNASLRFAPSSDRYSVTLYGQNLTDEYYIIAGEHNGGLNLYQVEGMPRTYGVRLAASF